MPSGSICMLGWHPLSRGAGMRMLSPPAAPPDIVGVDVVVVAACGAARQDELRHGHLGGQVHVTGLRGRGEAEQVLEGLMVGPQSSRDEVLLQCDRDVASGRVISYTLAQICDHRLKQGRYCMDARSGPLTVRCSQPA